MTIQNARSNVSGRLPRAIPADGQLFIQQADDILFTRKPDGTFRQFPLSKRAGVADAAYTVQRWDTYVGISTLTAPHAIQLPPANTYPPGHPLMIADESGNCSQTKQITLTPASGDAINGAVSLPQVSPNFGVILVSDGNTKWTSLQVAGNPAALAAAVTAAQAAQTAAETAAGSRPPPNGQCRLITPSATQLQLMPWNGNLLYINGGYRSVQSAPTLLNTGLAPNTFGYLYAQWTGTTVSLLSSTTLTPAVDPNYGLRTASGSPDLTYVGAFLTNANGQFQDTDMFRGVASLFNPVRRTLAGIIASNGSTSSTAGVPLGSPLQFVLAEATGCDFSSSGNVYNEVGGQFCRTDITLDQVASGYPTYPNSATNNAGVPPANKFAGMIPAGAHAVTLFGSVSGGTGHWNVALFGTLG